MTHEQIAKRANSLAHRILWYTKEMKNDTKWHPANAQWEAQEIAELCAELSNLVLPIRLPM